MEIKLIKRHIVGYDLSIDEKDTGSPVRILMGGTEEAQKENWRKLQDVVREARVKLDHPSLEKFNEAYP
jgi:hypothetical protein